MSQFWAIYKKNDLIQLLCPLLLLFAFFGAKRHFYRKMTKCLMVFYLHAKNYKKRLNGSNVRVIWKIERSDWSRAFTHKYREWEFSYLWDLRRKLANHNTLYFRSFLAKTNDSIFRKSPKTLFLGLFGPLLPIFEKMRIFPKNPALSLFYVYGPLTSCKKIEKTNEPILRKTVTDGQTDSKNPIFVIFLALFALNLKNENFPRYWICGES